MQNNKIHFKMYKSGKNWMTAGLVSTAVLAGLAMGNINNNVTAHADAQQPVTAQTNSNETVDQDAKTTTSTDVNGDPVTTTTKSTKDGNKVTTTTTTTTEVGRAAANKQANVVKNDKKALDTANSNADAANKSVSDANTRLTNDQNTLKKSNDVLNNLTPEKNKADKIVDSVNKAEKDLAGQQKVVDHNNNVVKANQSKVIRAQQDVDAANVQLQKDQETLKNAQNVLADL